MTTYDVSYDGITDEDEKRAKAIADIIDYMGMKRFLHIHETFRQQPMQQYPMFCHLLSFAGVQGYPAKAWYQVLHGHDALK